MALNERTTECGSVGGLVGRTGVSECGMTWTGQRDWERSNGGCEFSSGVYSGGMGTIQGHHGASILARSLSSEGVPFRLT